MEATCLQLPHLLLFPRWSRLGCPHIPALLALHLPHTLCHLPYTPRRLPCTSRHLPHTSCHLPHTSRHLPHTSRLGPNICLTRHWRPTPQRVCHQLLPLQSPIFCPLSVTTPLLHPWYHRVHPTTNLILKSNPVGHSRISLFHLFIFLPGPKVFKFIKEPTKRMKTYSRLTKKIQHLVRRPILLF